MAVQENKQTYPPLEIKRLADNLIIAVGSAGANTGILIGKDHVLLIDAKMTSDAVKELSAIIQTQVGKPVSVIVLTHSDIDHVGGIDSWQAPFKLISHEATKREIIAQAQRVPVNHLPDEVFSDTLNFNFEGNPVELIHVGPAHTGGDTAVLLPKLRTVFVGDLLFFHRDPLIHRQKGGSSGGLVKALDFLLTLDVDFFASGHSDPIGRTEVLRLRSAVAGKRDGVRSLAAKGISWEDIKTQLDIKDTPTAPGRPNFPSLAEVAYLEFIQENNN
jgi:glyoxylase-like metal-dependent hydrolase (beta-lactamase superfamily II)